MTSFNYISTLRGNCTPVDPCDKCACFTECLVGTELELVISGAGPSKVMTCAGGSCTGTLTIADLDGTYILPYAGAGAYVLTFASPSNPTAVRANGIKTWRQVCGSDQQETWIYQITVQLTCVDNAMTMVVSYQSICLHEISGTWTEDVVCFGWIRGPVSCGADTKTAIPRCSRDESMITETPITSDYTWPGCTPTGDCTPTVPMTQTGTIQ